MFESEKNEFLSKDEISDIFLELTDLGYSLDFFTEHPGIYFFELVKQLGKDSLGYIDTCRSKVGDNWVYGYTNLEFIKNEFNKIFDLLSECKEKLNSMGYLIGFEFENDITSVSDREIKIICHMAHSKYDK